MNQRINQLLIVVIISVFTSCSNESTNLASTEPDYIKIPDIQFKTKLINLGIDSDGVINQKILNLSFNLLENFTIEIQV